jgi:hypothetical protein
MAETSYVLGYTGNIPSLNGTSVRMQLKRAGDRAFMEVICPFCDQPMIQSSLSGKRRAVREERYRCHEGHRVSIIHGKDGPASWN